MNDRAAKLLTELGFTLSEFETDNSQVNWEKHGQATYAWVHQRHGMFEIALTVYEQHYNPAHRCYGSRLNYHAVINFGDEMKDVGTARRVENVLLLLVSEVKACAVEMLESVAAMMPQEKVISTEEANLAVSREEVNAVLDLDAETLDEVMKYLVDVVSVLPGANLPSLMRLAEIRAVKIKKGLTDLGCSRCGGIPKEDLWTLGIK